MKKAAKFLALAACITLIGACEKKETKQIAGTTDDPSVVSTSLKPLTECSDNKCTTELGNEMVMGDGTVRSYGVLDGDGGVQEIGVFISEAAITGLPMNCKSEAASEGAKWLI